MNLDGLVQITTVFPSPFGGAIFKGIRLGERSAISFRASYKVIVRMPKVGEFWRVHGAEMITKEYGLVIIVQSAALTNLPSTRYVGNLLSNHDAFRGISFGKAKVNKLLNGIGDFALVDLLNKGNYVAIADAGVNIDICKRVSDAWANLKEETDLATFLAEHNLDSSLAARVTRLCKYNVMARLQRNPYALISLSRTNISILKLVCKVAKKLGVSSEDDRASIGITEFALYEKLNHGHTMLLISELKDRLEMLRKEIGSNLSPEKIIAVSFKNKAICAYEEDGKIYIQAIGAAFIEHSVEKVITTLRESPLQGNLYELSGHSLRERIAAYNNDIEKNLYYRLTEQQCSGIEMALTNRVSLLSGFGGTGKTTVLRAIVDLAEENAIPVHVCALAGKAADRARQSINRETFTIHNLITQLRNPKGKVDAYSDPLIIIDEASMVDISLANRLFTAFSGQPFRLLLVGDTAQLPPIGFGLFWHVLVKSQIAKTHLNIVHRVVADSPLHHSAMKIREGESHLLPQYTGEEKGIYLLENNDNLLSNIHLLRHELDAVTLTSYANERYKSSTRQINKYLQDKMNRNTGSEMELGGTRILVNDPVIATTNVYHLEIYNGMTGVVRAIGLNESGEMSCEIHFDDRDSPVQLTKSNCWEIGLDLAYALTIHKSQGSEYGVCIICLSDKMERSALYTAITRTQKLCIVIGSQKQFNDAIEKTPHYETIKCAFRVAS